MNSLSEEALGREAHLRLLIEQIPIILWSTDAELRFTSSRGTDLAALDLRPNQVAGRSLFEYFQTDNLEFLPIAVHRRALQGEALTYEQGWRGRTYQVRVQPLRSLDGTITGTIGVALDISARKRAEESLRHDYELLRAVIEGTTDAVFVKDLQGRYVVINAAGARFLGKAIADILGKDDTELLSPETARQTIDVDRQVLASGETQDYEGISTAQGFTRMYLSTKGVCRDVRGNVIGLFVIARDISARKQVERRLTAEHAVARALAESAALPDAAPKILQAIGDNLGWDVGVLWNVDRQAQVLRCIEVWHTPEVAAPEFERLSRQVTFAAGVGLPGRVWTGGEPAWIADVAADAGFLRWPAARKEQLRGAFAFPVREGTEILGVLEFFSREIREPDEGLLDVMVNLSSQISQFIERRQAEKALHEQEREFDLARRIQQGLLPKAAPALAGFAIGGASQPAHKAGGDYFDFIPQPDGHLAIIVGDASGHGMGAALLMAETRAHARALALTYRDVRRILTLTNRRLAEDRSDDYFVTFFFARLNPVTRSLVYGNAGHWPGYLLDAHGKVRLVLHSTGPPLGIDPASDYPTARALTLEPGELLLLLTDGIVEAFSADATPFGMERTLDLVRAHRRSTPDEIVDVLFHAVREFSGNMQRDDMTAIVIKAETGDIVEPPLKPDNSSALP